MTNTMTLASSYEGTGGALVVILALVALVGSIILYVGAIISTIRSSNYAGGGKALWLLAILAFPVLGPVLWFAVGRTSSIGYPTVAS